MSSKRLYHFRLLDGRDLEVWGDVEQGYHSWMIRIEPDTYMASHVKRFRDGGTTRVVCALGELYVPAARLKQPATWQGQPITPILETQRPPPQALTDEQLIAEILRYYSLPEWQRALPLEGRTRTKLEAALAFVYEGESDEN